MRKQAKTSPVRTRLEVPVSSRRPHHSIHTLRFNGWASSAEGRSPREHGVKSKQGTAEPYVTPEQHNVRGTHSTAAGPTETCIKKSSS